MRILLNFFVILSLPFLLPRQSGMMQPKNSSQYCNARYEFCVDYPSDFFTQSTTADNGDGMIAFSENNAYRISISGTKNIMNANSRELFEELVSSPIEEGKSGLIFSIIKPTFFEAAYFDGDEVFYQKLKLQGSNYLLLQMEGPKRKYKKLKRMAEKINWETSS